MSSRRQGRDNIRQPPVKGQRIQEPQQLYLKMKIPDGNVPAAGRMVTEESSVPNAEHPGRRPGLVPAAQ